MRFFPHILIAVVIAVTAGCAQQSENVTLDEVIKKVAGPSRKELIGQMFESRDPDVRRAAIEELSSHDWGRMEPYLKAYAILTDDPAPTVRSAAVRALGRSGDVKYARKIIAALTDGEPSVRCDAAAAIDSIFTPEAIEPLAARAASDVSADVRIAAVRALRRYPRRDVLEVLLRCLNDPEFAVRFRAAKSLTELTGENVGPDADAWRRTLATKSNPFDRPVEPEKIPWWKRFRRRTKKNATETQRTQR